MKNSLVIALLTIFIFAQLGFAQSCPINERSIYVPAVVSGQEGGLLRVEVIVVPGNGSVYTAIDPTVGISTQLSQQQAVEEAFAGTGYSPDNCNVYFSFLDLNYSPSVDGPSAGMAMTVALRAALKNDTIRDDVVVTGAILPGGIDGQVGGIIDKGQAAARNNKKLFLTPKQQIYENILLSKLRENYNMTSIEVQNLSQAYGIATSPAGTLYSPDFKLENAKMPAELPARAQNADDKRFSQVAGQINNELQTAVEQQFSGELAQYKQHFKTEVMQNNLIISKGYAYTAANNAFLAQIDAGFLQMPPEKLDLQQEMDNAAQCLNSLPNVSLNDKNFEWVAGADARARWASTKLEEVSNASESFSSSEEKYLALRGVYNARSWCEAAYYMLLQAKQIDGNAISDGDVKAVAQTEVGDAKKMVENSLVPDADAAWHLEIAQKALSDGDYPAAIFDSGYVEGMQSATNSLTAGSGQNSDNDTLALAEKNYSSLWARVYQSQGVYGIYLANGNNASIGDTQRVLELSASMEGAMGKMRARINNPPISVDVNTAPKNSSNFADAVIGSFAILCIFFLLFTVYGKMKKAGRKG